MKFNVSYAFIASALLLASCSSEEPAAPAVGDGQEGYLAVDINLPTAVASRAVASYEDGTAAEYAVENGLLLIFEKSGASEADYKYVEAATLINLNWNSDADPQVTTKATVVAHLNNVNVVNAAEYYGLVVLNNPGINLPAVGATFGAWQKTAQPIAVSEKILMTSAPRFTTAGNVPTVLVKLDKSKIAASAATAVDAAAEIFVERAIAKVTLTPASTNEMNVTASAGSTYAGDKVDIEKWALDITSKTAFPVRYITRLNNDYSAIWSNSGAAVRFVGGTSTFQRVFWSEDPTYNADITTAAQVQANFNLVTTEALGATNNVGKSLYCLENTFDVNHQLQGQTTRVVFEAVYTPSGMTRGTTFFRVGTQADIYSQAELQNLIVTKLGAAPSSVTFNLGKILTEAGNHQLTVESVKINNANLTEGQLNSLKQLMGAEDGINTYLNGKSYYIARVKHFGDADCPWNIGDPTYNGDNAKYLGRYGVVRNNWYELSVTGISTPGEPTLPEPNITTPDDENSLYISVKVNVLPWAKRVQSVEL